MTHAERVPLEVCGVLAGSALVNEDGTIQLLMEGPNIFGQELLLQITRGTIKGLAISPVTETARPSLLGDARVSGSRDSLPNRNNKRNRFHPPT